MKGINRISRILLVDDDGANNFYNQSLLKDNLQFEGDIQVCLHGKDALDYLKNEGAYVENGVKYPKPDLILLDINMPVMDGFEFLEAYKLLSEEKKAQIIIYMVTSSLNEKDRARANQFPELNGYINKPLNLEGLEEIILKYFN